MAAIIPGKIIVELSLVDRKLLTQIRDALAAKEDAALTDEPKRLVESNLPLGFLNRTGSGQSITTMEFTSQQLSDEQRDAISRLETNPEVYRHVTEAK